MSEIRPFSENKEPVPKTKKSKNRGGDSRKKTNGVLARSRYSKVSYETIEDTGMEPGVFNVELKKSFKVDDDEKITNVVECCVDAWAKKLSQDDSNYSGKYSFNFISDNLDSEESKMLEQAVYNKAFFAAKAVSKKKTKTPLKERIKDNKWKIAKAVGLSIGFAIGGYIAYQFGTLVYAGYKVIRTANSTIKTLQTRRKANEDIMDENEYAYSLVRSGAVGTSDPNFGPGYKAYVNARDDNRVVDAEIDKQTAIIDQTTGGMEVNALYSSIGILDTVLMGYGLVKMGYNYVKKKRRIRNHGNLAQYMEGNRNKYVEEKEVVTVEPEKEYIRTKQGFTPSFLKQNNE